MAEKPKIEIKKGNRGKFTKYCKRKGYSGATWACEEEGLASSANRIRKMAQSSRNSRSWDK